MRGFLAHGLQYGVDEMEFQLISDDQMVGIYRTDVAGNGIDKKVFIFTGSVDTEFRFQRKVDIGSLNSTTIVIDPISH